MSKTAAFLFSAPPKPIFGAGGGFAYVLAVLLSFTANVQAQFSPLIYGHGKGAGPRLGAITQVEINVTNRAGVEQLVQSGFDVDSVRGDRVVLYADAEELASLRDGGWKMTIVEPPTAPPDFGTAKALGAYHSYSNLTARLDDFAATFPSLCRKVSIGKSVQKRDLWAMKITSYPDCAGDKPKFKYIGTMHGHEPLGSELCLRLIDLLLTGYQSNDVRIVNLVNNVEIWILPLMNPDGWESKPPRRYNANGYDLNRSFPEGSATNMGSWLYGPPMNTNGLQAEVRAVMAWTATNQFTLGANLHSGALVVNYPYDNDGLGSVFSPTPDEALLQAMSRTYSSNNLPMWNSTYFADGIVSGAAWYSISGGMQDWNYRYAGCFDVTIELSDGQWPNPPASQLPTFWSQNQESMLAYLEWALRGVRGIIRDARTGRPVQGAVRVEGYPHLVFSDSDVGDYHRILLPGNYALWFQAPGYVARRIPDVVVGSCGATRLDVFMQPVSPRFAAKINFQPPAASVPKGFHTDSGAAYGDRGEGYSYGWETTLADDSIIERGAGRSQDLRYDTLSQLQAGGNHTWEIAVPNGLYSVLVVAGDPLYSTGLYRIAVEDVLLLDGVPSSSNRWVEALGTVLVTDRRLTISNGPGAISNRLAYVEISAGLPHCIGHWRGRFFGNARNCGRAADDADPDGDGIANLLEYAFGLDPACRDHGSQLLPVITHANGIDRFSCSFRRNTRATDLTFHLQATDELSVPNWKDVACWKAGSGWTGLCRVEETPSSSDVMKVTVLDARPIFEGASRFMRLYVTADEDPVSARFRGRAHDIHSSLDCVESFPPLRNPRSKPIHGPHIRREPHPISDTLRP